jgi:hypothetical protein
MRMVELESFESVGQNNKKKIKKLKVYKFFLKRFKKEKCKNIN